MNSMCASPYQGVKLGLAKTQGGQTLGASLAWDVSCPSALITSG